MSVRPLRRAFVAVALAVAGLGVTQASAAAAGPEHVDFYGHGWGHGRGMGQYGARGYADDYGWSADQILNHFYGNTSAGTVSSTQAIRVLLCAQEGVLVCSSGQGVGTLVVASGASYRVEGNDVPAGQAVRIRRLADRFELVQAPGGCSASQWTALGSGSSFDSNIDIDPLAAPASTSQMLQVCSPVGRTYRGALDVRLDGSRPRLINTLPVDEYLRGVVPAEMPASWNPAAVQAQAVSARSYALADGRFEPVADTCDTVQCQVYNGATAEATGSNSAIVATAGKVRLRNGAVMSTEFSSSTGGWSAGGTFPAVQDHGDSISSNPNHSWSVRVTDDAIEAKYRAIGDFQAIEVQRRNGLGAEGGRVDQVRLVGAAGEVTVTGDALRSALGLKSDWFTPSVSTPPPSKIVWTLRSTATAGAPTSQVAYGLAGERAIACDWDGDGDSSLGVYSGGTWSLRNDLSAGTAQTTIAYGTASYVPVCGDWDGDGDDTIGVYTSDGWWYLRNDNSPGPPHLTFQYGYVGARPVVGDWDGRAEDGIGVYDAGTWLLRDQPGGGTPQRQISYGYAAAWPVIGDWDGDGFDGIGVYDSGSWMLRETASAGSPVRWFDYGYAGTEPITGRWAAAADGIGIISLG